MSKTIYKSILKSFSAGLLMAIAINQVNAQSTIVVAAKSQSESGQSFNFTSTIPGGSSFTLNDNAAYIPAQDVGVGQNNTVWITRKSTSTNGLGTVYFRPQGSTAWTQLAGAGASRIDVDRAGIAYMTGGGGNELYSSDGTNLISLGGSGIADVGVSAGAVQPVYILAGNGPCYDLYRYNNVVNSFIGITGICGSRLDVAPDGSIWMLGLGGNTISHIAVTGNTGTVLETFSGNYSDVTVAADGEVWATVNALSYRKVGNSFEPDLNSGGIGPVPGDGGISAGSDGDTPFVAYQAASTTSNTTQMGRLIQRTENGTWLDDHSVRTSPANTVIYNVAPGTYTITEASPASPWQLTNITTSSSAIATNLATRTASVTVVAGQTAHIEFNNANIISSVISNICGQNYTENFGTAGTTDPTFGPALPNGYTSYHYDGAGDRTSYGAGQYSIVNSSANTFVGANFQDHTPGDVGGYYMFVNGGFAKEEFFRRRFSGLLPGATYFLSLQVASWSVSPGNVLPNLQLEARNTNGTILGVTTTGDIARTGSAPVWREFSLQFTADASGIADFIIRNNQQTPGVLGNDFAIDDIVLGTGCDYGDAPDSYSTNSSTGGPSHKVTSLLKMGKLIDADVNGMPVSTALGDDNSNLKDEDGISSFPVISGLTGSTITNYIVNVTVSNTTASTANLCGWIDWNSNGFFDANEKACTTVAVGSTSTTLTWPSATLTRPAGSTGTFARFRLSTDANLLPTGSASNGEVEDYAIPFNMIVPDLTPTTEIDELNFAEGAARDFVVNVFEILDITTAGQVRFRINKISGFTITYPTASGTSNVFGGTPNQNSNWTFTENASFITVTANAGINIAASGKATLGFRVARNPNVASGTTQNITATIIGGSGGETRIDNNNVVTSISAN